GGGGAVCRRFGGLGALAARTRGGGAGGTGGGGRDVEEIGASDLWLASRSVTPTTGKTRLKLEALDEPVTIGGTAVKPGDLVVGGDTGIVVVPRTGLDRRLELAERMLTTECAPGAGLPGGEPVSEAATRA